MIILRQKQFSLVSRAYRWINEMRGIEPLPLSLEEYIRLTFPVKHVNGFIKREWPLDLFEKLDKYYGQEGAGKLLCKIGAAYAIDQFPEDRNLKIDLNYNDKYFKKAIDYSWDKIQRIPKRYITKALGAGVYGIAFNYPGNKIEKISFRGFRDSELKFYGYLKKNKDLPIFPKVYSLEDDQVIMERLLLDTPKVEKWKRYIDEYIEKVPKTNPRLPTEKKARWDKIMSELGEKHEFTIFVRSVESGLEKIFGVKTVGDLTKSNIGERKGTGEIVFFDPITDGIEPAD